MSGSNETAESAVPAPKPHSLWGEKNSKYLQVSPYASDGGELIGRSPADIAVPDLRALGGPDSPTKAIRAKCLDCSGHNEAEVRKCVAINCPLWPFRMGRSPFYGKSSSDQEDATAS